MRKIPPLLGLPPTDTTKASVDRIKLVVPLKLITPMIGGGVDKNEINREQPVRAASVRGVLRFWWRALQLDVRNQEDLYERECRIWGGQLPGQKEASGKTSKGKTLKGRVSIHIAPISEGDFTFISAGVHKYDSSRTRHRSPARLDSSMPDSFLYGLFPLQYASEDLRRFGKQDAALPSVAVAGKFTVVLDLDCRTKKSQSGQGAVHNTVDAQVRADLLSVVCALKVWAMLGGIGARTRRGYGSVEIDGSVIRVDSPEACHDLAQSFKTIVEKIVLAENISNELSSIVLQQLKGNHESIVGSQSWPVLGDSPEVVLSESNDTPNFAIGRLLGQSLSFYQRSPIGRFKSNDVRKRHGESRWPEPDVMKYFYRLRNSGKSIKFGHKPRRTKVTELSVPRAARGMPLRIVFIGDRADQQANGEILPLNGDRLPSPLIFRAIKSENGQYRALLLRLNCPALKEVQVKLDNDFSAGANMIIPVKSANPIKSQDGNDLCKEGEDAITAFITYLRKSKEFT